MSNPFFSNKGPISLAQIFNILKITNEKKTDFDLFDIKDLNNAKEVVKPGGLILGDDYGWPDAKWQKKGVTKAVNEFINKNNITNMIRHGMTQYEIRL